MNFPFISNTSGSEYGALELFGFCATLAVLAAALWRWARSRPTAPAELAPLGAFVLLGCYFAAQTTEYAPPSTDWRAYIGGAQALLGGQNPYAVEGYIYPPFFAQALATVYRGVSFASSFVRSSDDPDFLWKGVLYVYQCFQFFLALGACGLTYLLGIRCGLRKDLCAALVAGLYVFNVPIMRTIHNHQVNFYVLDALLIAVLGARQSPFVSGIAVGVASHLKLYPAILMVPAALAKEFRFILWTVLCIVAVLLLQVAYSGQPALYGQYLTFMRDFPGGTAFRDNSTHSLVFNTVRALTGFQGAEGPVLAVTRAIVLVLSAAAVAYFGLRFAARERLGNGEGQPDMAVGARLRAHMMDSIAALMVLSPIVWEHHYVLMIPVAVWAFATVGRNLLPAAAVGAFLMFAVPVFDVYPLSYHRLAGLVLLLACTHPRRTGAKR
jgi:hypothetical protein